MLLFSIERRIVDREHDPQADAPVVTLTTNFVSLGNRAVNGPVVKAATSEDSFFAWADVWRAVSRNLSDVTREHVLTPFPYVAGHVVNAKLVGGFLRDGLSVIAVLAVVPGHILNVVAAAKAEIVAPVGAAAGGVFPLCLA